MMNRISFYDKSILGLNERNLKYIRTYNPSYNRKIADDKLLTKKILIENGIPTPQLIGEIKSYRSLEKFNFSKLPGSVVVKPKRGFGGEGIIVFFSKDKDGNWVKADKTRYSTKDLINHIIGILEGNFSLKNRPDTAFFEERVLMHPEFKKYSFRGIPDIRIIVFNKVPVMAMMRLPTKESDGKANLHAGGVAVGIDIASGITTSAVHHDKPVDRHPDSGVILKGFKVPYWDEILEMAIASQIHTGLGFLGVDIVIDRVKGPMVLELNVRPGLAIQIANSEGLKGRLERVAGLKIKNIKKGIQIGKDLFGGEVEEEIEQVSGKQLVGRVEYIIVFGKDNVPLKVKAKNDTGAFRSSIDENLARDLGFGDVLDKFNQFKAAHSFSSLKEARKIKLLAQREFEDIPGISGVALVKQSTGIDLRPIIKLTFQMSGITQSAKFTVAQRKNMSLDVIIGRKALKKFLIDPASKFLG